MASLFKKPNSPFWYLRFKRSGKWVKEALPLRHDDPNETALARQTRAEWEARECKAAAAPDFRGWAWVEPYIATSGLAKRSIERYSGAWKWIALWLGEVKLDVSGVRYAHVNEYITWRVGRKKRTGKAAGRNTAIQEVKILAAMLNEAVRREYITASPLAALKIRKDPAPKKRAFTDQEIDRCREALKSEPDWMRISFEISLCTGCRLKETRIPMDKIEVDGALPTITFPSPKGGEAKSFTVPMPKQLEPLLTQMREQGKEWTIDAFPFQPSRRWQQFFAKLKIEKVSFHCLRVTKVTLLRRGGVPREAAMRLVNHSSELMHMIYDRHQVADLAAYRDQGIAGSSDVAK